MILLGVVVLGGAAGGVFLMGDDGRVERPSQLPTAGVVDQHDRAGGGSPAPTYYSSTPSGEAFRPIADRSADSAPLAVDEIFTDAVRSPSYRGVRLSLRETRLDSNCVAAVWGSRLKRDLERNGCSQAVRGVYVGTDARVLGMVVVFNMKDVEGATAIIEAVNPQHKAGFVLPLSEGRGDAGWLGRGYSEAHAHAMGHFVFVRWAQQMDGSTPDSRFDSTVSKVNVALTDAQWGIRQRALAAG